MPRRRQQRKRPPATTLDADRDSPGPLGLRDASMIGVRDGHRWEGVPTVCDRLVVIAIARCVADLECHGCAPRHSPCRSERSELGSHARLRQPGEYAGVHQVCHRSHLLAGSPGVLGGGEVESSILAEHRHQLEASPGMDDLVERGIDGLAQRGRAQDVRSFSCDISNHVNRCLGQAIRISRAEVAASA